MPRRSTSPWTQTDMRSLTDRMSGKSRSSTTSARGISQRLGKTLGQSRYTVYNVDTNDLSDERKAALIESVKGSPASKGDVRRFKIERVESQDFRKRTRPVDRVSGERLDIYRDMKAYQITFS